ncbi:MAG: hypothetical protein R2695_12875 [Acidimicrobiales bacterium]
MWRLGLLVAGVFVLASCNPPPADQVLVVDTTADTVDAVVGDGICADDAGDCSLRAAVMEANADPDITEIQLTGGSTYTLTIPGAGEDLSATGDLDLRSRTYIRSALGTGQATIDGNGLDRVVDAVGGSLQYLEGLDIVGGDTSNASPRSASRVPAAASSPELASW